MSKLQILIVDDDAVFGFLLGELLEEMGFDVCGIETTQSGAIAAALLLNPDVMIVDENLSPGSGAATMAALEIHGKIPHILMSGAGRVAGQNGAPVLLKPFSEESLAAAIACATEARST
jgi:DNA-binding response OmpR family regulator